MKRSSIFAFLLLVSSGFILAQKDQPAFQLIPLGVMGGIDEANLSSYLLAPINNADFICLDAGTVYAGIEKAVAHQSFDEVPLTVLQNRIKGYLISHAHLDHVSGLIIGSPADVSKTIYASGSTMKMMQDHYFNGETWANFGDEGPGFQIKKYHFQTLAFQTEVHLKDTQMEVTAFPLSHVNPFESTAFLIRTNQDYVLYLGDTGPDKIEKSSALSQLWKTIAPLVISQKLRAICIETSFPNEQPDSFLFGHLTPKWLMEELSALKNVTNLAALQKVKIVITHVKPPVEKIALLKKELIESNTMGLQLVFPEQGKRIEL
ncbi:MBL fold metallo-hydrolase [Flavobacterium agrisoli]|uniref:3',5'-cyclic-nucleotide phosphodiesterase n=1 Tax=Flavobacterium agrisoli TaxID=2793066 RepID=A0A934PMK5_9FLAO|nr:3',5'-cyclic-nucleotide phosphodiesterase [Flavobacterium agrisoli]MBK0369589.1 3',5'-cyclic-nucleotide phosphodiesterase [Flavobacterium agrisoli]